MKTLFIILILLIILPAVIAKEMPIPHFTPSDCSCPELGWPIKSNYSSSGLDLGCVYQKSDEKDDYYNTLNLYITSWYDPKDTDKALEIYRNYDYKNEKEGYGKDKLIIEDINDKDKISYIYRNGKASYWLGRKVHYTDTPLIAISGNYNIHSKDKNQEPIDGEVIGWADKLEKCAKRLIDSQDLTSEKVKGKITVLGKPIKYATIYIDPEQKTTTNEKGEFTISVPNKEHYDIILEHQYEKNDHIFYRVLMDKDPIKLKIEVINNKINSLEFDVGLGNYNVENVKELNQDIITEIALDKMIQDKDILLIPVNYLHMQEALEYYTDILKVDLTKNTVDLFIYTGTKSTYNFDENKKWINLDPEKSSYEDNYRPFTTYHEFSHYVQHIIVGTNTFSSILDEKNINHGGYANERSSDSFSEGFASFMATVIANHQERYWADAMSNKPSLYPYFGSLEPDIFAWEYQGKAEDYAIAGVLWDLVDGEIEAKNDSSADKAVIREVLEEQFKKYDSNSDNIWDRSEFIHSLVDSSEYNGNYDNYFDERELPILAEAFTNKNESEQFLKKILAYGKSEQGTLTQDEMYSFIKDNMDFFEAELKEDTGTDYDNIPNKITLEMLMDKISDSPDDDDDIDMKIEEVWELIKKSDFNLPLKDLKNADKILISHGIYVETSIGDKTYNYGEPYFNKNKNKRRDADEPYIDLGEMKYDSNEKLGIPSNYERINRKSSFEILGNYIKTNKEIPFYDIEYIVSDQDYYGLNLPNKVYRIRARNNDGLVYVPLIKNAIVKVKPEGVITKEPLIFKTDSYLNQIENSIDKDYFIENKFSYTGTPPVYKNRLSGSSENLLLYVGVISGIILISIVVFFIIKRPMKDKH